MRLLLMILLVLVIVLGGFSYKSHQKTQALKRERETTQLAEEAEKKRAHENEIRLAQEAVKIQEEEKQDEEKKEGERIALLQAKAAEALFDPSSAQFRNVKLNTEKSALCGDINAKNKLGGYVGFRPFVATESAAAIWNGGKCDNAGSYSAQIACLDEELVYLSAARRNGCKTQAELNLIR